MNQSLIDKIIHNYDAKTDEVLEMMLDIQQEEGYLSKETVQYLAQKLNLLLSQVYRIAGFYEGISLKPMGDCQINVCTGTACHVRGASKIVDEFKKQLGIGSGEVTDDLSFGLKTVSCVGACALGPVVTVNGDHQGNVVPHEVGEIINNNQQESIRQA